MKRVGAQEKKRCKSCTSESGNVRRGKPEEEGNIYGMNMYLYTDLYDINMKLKKKIHH